MYMSCDDVLYDTLVSEKSMVQKVLDELQKKGGGNTKIDERKCWDDLMLDLHPSIHLGDCACLSHIMIHHYD